MSQSWKPLPDDLAEPARRLAEELRAVKDAHRISLAELGKRTYLSKASWERWLNGKRLITPQALAGLIAAVDCDGELLTSLLRQAEAARDASGGSASGPVPVPVPVSVPVPVTVPGSVPEPVPVRPTEAPVQLSAPPVPQGERLTDLSAVLARIAGWRRPWTLVAAALAVALVVVASLYLHGRNAGTTAAAAGPTGLCQGIGCAGKDPQVMGCEDDDHTLLTGNVGQVILYLHYSPRCRAAWAGLTDGAPGDTATITNNTGWQETALIHWGYDAYSAMVDAGPADTTLRVCGHQPGGDGCIPLVTNPAARASAMPTPAPKTEAPRKETPTPSPTPTSTPVPTP
ncbi:MULTISPECIES: DUF2690 domain-containing protein [Kitasatospora]|uniref:DUF2690 domain-containing protein n=1 Tax=Kitasatospora cathayae TaxID=3004092 RepID=A0ABY7PXV6_9ACTN|nr:DUF2690 domain-containing protein [Kitasatospora sp. HUAS 3-15]WBP85272.1 DUF2690 domain-containing protein [Kitasatospora sp. HUAS 3-15]